MSIEILIPTTRTLGGATQAVVEQLLGTGFMNIDAPETDAFEVELTNVDAEEWGEMVPEAISAQDLGDKIKGNREILRVRVPLRLGHFLLFPGFVSLCRPDNYQEFMSDPRARQIVGRESLELANAFMAPEILICGDAATDFLGTEATNWDELKDVLREEAIDHQLIVIPREG